MMNIEAFSYLDLLDDDDEHNYGGGDDNDGDEDPHEYNDDRVFTF